MFYNFLFFIMSFCGYWALLITRACSIGFSLLLCQTMVHCIHHAGFLPYIFLLPFFLNPLSHYVIMVSFLLIGVVEIHNMGAVRYIDKKTANSLVYSGFISLVYFSVYASATPLASLLWIGAAVFLTTHLVKGVFRCQNTFHCFRIDLTVLCFAYAATPDIPLFLICLMVTKIVIPVLHDYFYEVDAERAANVSLTPVLLNDFRSIKEVALLSILSLCFVAETTPTMIPFINLEFIMILAVWSYLLWWYGSVSAVDAVTIPSSTNPSSSIDFKYDDLPQSFIHGADDAERLNAYLTALSDEDAKRYGDCMCPISKALMRLPVGLCPDNPKAQVCDYDSARKWLMTGNNTNPFTRAPLTLSQLNTLVRAQHGNKSFVAIREKIEALRQAQLGNIDTPSAGMTP